MVGQTKKLAVVISATLSMLVLARVITISPVLIDSVISCCTYPLVVAQRWVVTPLKNFSERRKSVEELSLMVQEYQLLVEELRAENIELKATQEHLQQTEAMRTFAQRYHTDRVVEAQVVLQQFSPAGHFFLVNAGHNRGVTVDMIAVYQNCLLGRVTEVYPWYAKVVLISDVASKVPAICTTTHTQGIHEGCNSLDGSQLSFVSHLQPLQVGDILVASGDGLIYPKGFALGTIGEFTLDSLGLNYIVNVRPMLDMHAMTHCYLIAKGAEYEPAAL